VVLDGEPLAAPRGEVVQDANRRRTRHCPALQPERHESRNGWSFWQIDNGSGARVRLQPARTAPSGDTSVNNHIAVRLLLVTVALLIGSVSAVVAAVLPQTVLGRPREGRATAFAIAAPAALVTMTAAGSL
jgi:hypothetical protein